jgi:hypothetical protein
MVEELQSPPWPTQGQRHGRLATNARTCSMLALLPNDDDDARSASNTAVAAAAQRPPPAEPDTLRSGIPVSRRSTVGYCLPGLADALRSAAAISAATTFGDLVATSTWKSYGSSAPIRKWPRALPTCRPRVRRASRCSITLSGADKRVREHAEEEVDPHDEVRCRQHRLQLLRHRRLAHARRPDERDQLTPHRHSVAPTATIQDRVRLLRIHSSRPERPGPGRCSVHSVERERRVRVQTRASGHETLAVNHADIACRCGASPLERRGCAPR